MGDGGAVLLGFLMATLGLKLHFEQLSYLAGWLAPILFLSSTIFATTLVRISRTSRGLLPFAAPDKDHPTHRLANLGLGQRGAVLAIYPADAVGGCAALLVVHLSTLGTRSWRQMLLSLGLLESAPYEHQLGKSSA